MGVAKPQVIKQAAWDYLAAFTEYHEALVVHMYDTFGGNSADITCGIGTKLYDRGACLRFKSLFSRPDGGAASDADMQYDYDQAAKTTRVGLVADHQIAEFAAVCKLRVDMDKARDEMKRAFAVEKLPALLNPTIYNGKNPFVEFPSMPAYAQVALLSHSYGSINFAEGKHAFRQLALAIHNADYDRAAAECVSSTWSPAKMRAHTILWNNAAQVVKQSLNPEQIQQPSLFDPPFEIPKV